MEQLPCHLEHRVPTCSRNVLRFRRLQGSAPDSPTTKSCCHQSSSYCWYADHYFCDYRRWYLYRCRWLDFDVSVHVSCSSLTMKDCVLPVARRYHMHLQKTLRVLFNTRLGHAVGQGRRHVSSSFLLNRGTPQVTTQLDFPFAVWSRRGRTHCMN